MVMVVGLYSFSGVSGVVSFGHLSFAMIAAYTSALLTIEPDRKRSLFPDMPGFLDWIIDVHLGVLPAMFVAMAVAAVFAAIVGVALMRLGGVQAAISTLALFVDRHRRHPGERHGHAGRLDDGRRAEGDGPLGRADLGADRDRGRGHLPGLDARDAPAGVARGSAGRARGRRQDLHRALGRLGPLGGHRGGRRRPLRPLHRDVLAHQLRVPHRLPDGRDARDRRPLQPLGRGHRRDLRVRGAGGHAPRRGQRLRPHRRRRVPRADRGRHRRRSCS